MLIAGHGIEVDLPEGWEGRLYRRAEGNPILHAANFPLPPEDGDFGTLAVDRMDRDGVFIVLAEYNKEVLGRPLFADRGLPLPLRGEDASPRALQRLRPGRAGLQRFFTVNGRPFCLYVVIGRNSDSTPLIERANSVLGSLVVDERGSE